MKTQIFARSHGELRVVSEILRPVCSGYLIMCSDEVQNHEGARKGGFRTRKMAKFETRWALFLHRSLLLLKELGWTILTEQLLVDSVSTWMQRLRYLYTFGRFSLDLNATTSIPLPLKRLHALDLPSTFPLVRLDSTFLRHRLLLSTFTNWQRFLTASDSDWLARIWILKLWAGHMNDSMWEAQK